jgi:P4 family phage/plasmid primase-like protien
MLENNKDGSGASNNKITSSNNINVSTTKTYEFQDLPYILNLLAENGIINLLPLKPGSKEPKLKSWKPYQTKRYPLKDLKRHKGNFGVITGDPLNQGVGNLVILDIDDKKGPEGLYKHFKDIDTLQVKTASKGYHIYFWSVKPVEDANYIGKLFNLEIELRGKSKIFVVIPPSSVKYPDGFIGAHELIKTGKKDPIMDLKDVEDFIKNKLIETGYKPDNNLKRDITTIEPLQGVVNDGRWKRTLKDEEINQLVELLKPLYKEGQRHYLTLHLSGWMYKADIDIQNTIQIIKGLAGNNPNGVNNGIKATRNSYRGIKENIKGSIYEYIAAGYKDEDFEDEAARKIKINQTYADIARIINHKYSIPGMEYFIKHHNGYSKTTFRRIAEFIIERNQVVIEHGTDDIYLYNYDNGFYQYYDDKQFQGFIKSIFPDLTLELSETSKIKSMVTNYQKPESHIIHFKNGLLDTKTFKFTNHDSEKFVKKIVPYNYDENTYSDFFESKIKEILIDKEGTFQGEETKFNFFLEILGYCFKDSNPYHAIFFITGEGRNGKSVLSDLIKTIFGVHAVSVPLHNLQSEFGKEPLIDKMINLVYDLPKKMLKETGDLKAIVGEDQMTIPIKYKESWTGTLGTKIIAMGNYLPKINDASKGFWDRIGHMELNNRFVGEDQDQYLKDKLKDDILGIEWLIFQSIEAFKRVEKSKCWSIPIGTEHTKNEYTRLSDPCLYAAETLFHKTTDKNDFILKEEVVKAITELLKTENLEIPRANQVFYDAIRAIGGEDGDSSINNRTVHGFTLLRFKTPDMEGSILMRNKEKEVEDWFSLNSAQQSIINELGIGSCKYETLVNELEVKTSFNKEDLNYEINTLVKDEVIQLKPCK